MATIYVVTGSTGEFSDYQEWSVCAFTKEILAVSFVEGLTTALSKLGASSESGDVKSNLTLSDRAKIAEEMNDLDPQCRVDYTGTRYFYYPLELIDA